MSTPASVVNAANPTPSAAAAFDRRAPSTWTTIPNECACSQIALISAGVYSVPSSVDCVIDTASGWARCSSPKPQASRSMSSGVSFPSGVSTV